MLVCICRSVVPQIENRMAISEVDFRKWFVEKPCSTANELRCRLDSGREQQDAIDKRMRGGDQTEATKTVMGETKIAS